MVDLILVLVVVIVIVFILVVLVLVTGDSCESCVAEISRGSCAVRRGMEETSCVGVWLKVVC